MVNGIGIGNLFENAYENMDSWAVIDLAHPDMSNVSDTQAKEMILKVGEIHSA